MSLPAFGSAEGEIVRALLLGAGFAVVIALASLWRRLASPPVEWTRKAIHAGCGLLLLGLPWWIARVETLAALTLVALLGLVIARRAGWLPGLFAVERASRGELYFPLAVFVAASMTESAAPFSHVTKIVRASREKTMPRGRGAVGI